MSTSSLINRVIFVIAAFFVLGNAAAVTAQRTAAKPKATPKPAEKSIVFAVLNDGKVLEPIAHIEGGKLTETVDGSDESTLVKAFTDKYYKAGSSYRLIFGGSNSGTVAVAADNSPMECGPNMAQATTTSTRATLKGKVMALATNFVTKKPGSGVRRLPTWPERNEIDAAIRAEYSKNQIEIKKLDYHNLTALDVDGDKKAELVGSYWVENDPKSRILLFFIAEKGADGKYAMRFSDLRSIKEDEVMSGDIASLDDGVYHELLLDVLDYDNDGVSEIFTYVQSFEGAGFNVYKRGKDGWSRAFEGTNYHCGY